MIKPRVLVIDDDYGNSRVLQKDLISKIDPSGRCEFSFCSGQIDGHNSMSKVLDEVASGWPLDALPSRQGWALVLLDIMFAQHDPDHEDDRWGFRVLRSLRERWSDLPVVMLTSEDDAKKSEANWGQADGFLPKPTAVATVAERAFVTRLYSFGLFPDLREKARVAGRSLVLCKVLQEARRFACDPLGSGRLLYGETGTGKTQLASFIHEEMHALAGRSKSAFRTWSAAGTDEDIARNTLFGRWGGSFTGGATDQPGEIEKAEGGTFFLDEIWSLPIGVQALFMECRRRNEELRRLIQRMGTIQKDGLPAAKRSLVEGVKLQPDGRIAVDVVMLTASNVNLHDEEVADRLGFRRDLLNDLGAPIYLPPLNERRGDIPEIFEQIVGDIHAHLRRPTKHVDDRVLLELQSRDWTKKNVVALRQIAEHAVIAARDFDEILIRHMPSLITVPNWAGSRPPNFGSAAPEAAIAMAGGATDSVPSIADLPKLLDVVDIPRDPSALEGVLPDIQRAYARLVLKLFGAALRTTQDRRGDTSSLSAVCKLLGVTNLKSTPQSYAAYDVVLRMVSLCDIKLEGLPAERCELLSDEPAVRERVEQAITQRRRPVKKAMR